MHEKNSYEKTGLKNRLKELSILSVFIIFSAVISILIMDLTVFPIALFAIKKKVIYTHVINNLLWITILTSLIFTLIKKIYFLKKSGFKLYQII